MASLCFWSRIGMIMAEGKNRMSSVYIQSDAPAVATDYRGFGSSHVPLHVLPVSSGATHLFGVLEAALRGMLYISLAAPTAEGHYTDIESVG